jgi:hypothetical protein
MLLLLVLLQVVVVLLLLLLALLRRWRVGRRQRLVHGLRAAVAGRGS